jgi:hypothetical protein
MRVWTHLNWLRIGSCGGLFGNGSEPSDATTVGKCADELNDLSVDQDPVS